MLRLPRFLMHHFTCVFNGNAYIILINSDFQKQRQVKISVKRRLIGVILTQCILKTMLIRTIRKFVIQQVPGILKYNYRFHYNAVYILRSRSGSPNHHRDILVFFILNSPLQQSNVKGVFFFLFSFCWSLLFD